MARFGPRAIFRELRRRRLFNTVGLYIVGAWVILQVADLAFPGMDIPDSAIRHVWIGAFLLFPLVLIFGWFYDVSSEGVRRTPPAGAVDAAGAGLNRRDHGMIGVLSSIALGLIVFTGIRISQVAPDPTLTTIENSIAVLPFEVCEDLAQERKLAGGLTMEVINRLAERGKLKVIAHSSTYMLAGMAMPKQTMAGHLGVQYLLNGKVCRYEGELTLAAELFDERGFVVWSDSYIQKVNQWDQITGRLATLVASGVATQLGDVTQDATDAPVNRFAYEQFLIGTRQWDTGNHEQAREAFEQALGYEPEYAEAQFYLAILDSVEYLSEGREESIEQARPDVERALLMARRQLEQNDRSAYNHYMVARLVRELTSWDEELAFRWNHASDLDPEEVSMLREKFRSEFAESERHFRTAVSLNPSLTAAYVWLADVMEKQGLERRTEALEILEDGLVRDPFNLLYNSRIAKRWAARGRYRQAIELLERFKDLPEIPSGAWWWQLELMQLHRHWDEKAETLVDMLQNDPGAFDNWYNRWQIWWFVSSLAELGLYEEAEAWKVRIENIPMFDWSRKYGRVNYLAATGRSDEVPIDNPLYILFKNKDYEAVIERLATQRHERRLWHEREVRDDMLLIAVYQLTGRDEEAQALLDSTLSYLETEYAMGIRHPETLYTIGEVYARNGQDKEAIEWLRKSYDYNRLIRCRELEDEDFSIVASPWIRLSSDPDYVSLCQRIDADLAQQGDQVRTLLARYDVDELLAPLMALVPAESEMR